LLLLTLLVGINCTKTSNSFKRSSKQPSGFTENRRSPQSPNLGTKRMKPVYTAREKAGDSAGGKRPNIILILTDDQDVELGSLKFMPKLNKHLKEEGLQYENGFVSTPMCCPSRSSLLTGLYVHNHKVFTNNDNCSSTHWVNEHEGKTFAAYLQDSGYSTGYFGKYLNKYMGQHVPTGWGEWHGLLRNSRFYNYSLNVNGQIHHHGFDYQRDYLPDIITNRSLNFLRWSKKTEPDTPVMAVLAYPGPHGPEDAAPQYQHLFFNVTTHHTPAYDFAPNPDKQWILRQTDKMQDVHKHFTDLLMTKRLQTLQSVDDGIEKLVATLEELGELDNTYIFYTSDHGYHLGQYGLVKGKAFPFDVDTKVPFLVRGPGIAKNQVRKNPVVNIDLAPTFLDIAGLQKAPHMDGTSILPTITDPDVAWRSGFLLERGKMTHARYAKVTEFSNEVLHPEFQDLLTSKTLTKAERLEIECKKPRYKAPCAAHQSWFCKERPDGQIKMKRCRSGIAERFGLETRRSSCHCRHGDVYGWKYSKLDAAEKQNQKKFLHKHVPDSRRIRQRFLKTLPRLRSVSRQARSAQDFHGIFEDVAHEELEEVDGLVEDIAEEIRDLHKLNTTEGEDTGCKMDRDNIVCINEVFQNKKVWETSRTTVKHQIQRLRAQLNELKQIRKYLKNSRPAPKRRMRVLPLHLRAYKLEDDFRRDDMRPDEDAEICLCDKDAMKATERQILRASRMREREEKKLEKMRRKERKRIKMERKERRKNNPRKADHCKVDVKMNCFSHDNEHWRTAPLWTEGPFCACTNSNNNTYWCVRNINSTHNYLYCEYVTGMVTYFDMKVDPHQLRNVLHTLTDTEVNYMHTQVIELRNYSAENDFLQEQKQMRALARKLQASGSRSFKPMSRSQLRGRGDSGRKAGGDESGRKAGGGGGARKLQRHVLDRKRKREQQERKRLRLSGRRNGQRKGDRAQ